jgi:DNA repair protein SbcC/Rad50
VRPLHLALTGFRSHERTTELSFEDRSLIAIVGPTGAGKSTILDGISYALYAKTPREERDVKDLICSRAEQARVELRFSVDGREYEITRVLRRKAGPSPHVLRDLSSGDAISGRSAVTDKVVELLGLDFAGFGAAVLLAQGEFARFLHATPSKRSQILKGVFRLEEIDALREAARGRVDRLEGDLREIEGERRGIPADVDQELGRALDRRARASQRAAALLEAIPHEQRLEGALRDASSELERARAERAKLEAALEKVPAEDRLRELEEQGASIADLIAGAESGLAAATQERSAAVRARAELVAQVGTEIEVLGLRAAALDLDRANHEMAEQDESLVAHESALKDLRKDAAEGEAALAAARVAARAATAEREAIEQAHSAHALRVDLRVGAPCPVCERPVEAVPATERLAAIKDVKAAERSAHDAERDASEHLGALATKLAVAESTREHLLAELARTRAGAEKLGQELRDAMGPVASFVDEAEGRLARLEAAAARLERADEARERAQKGLDDGKGLEQDFARLCRGASAALIEVAADAGLEPPSFDDPIPRLVGHAQATSAALRSRVGEVAERVEFARRAGQEAGESLRALRATLGLRHEITIASAFADARADAEVADAACADLEKKRVRARELDDQEAALSARRQTFRRLASDLSDSKFTSFLLEERTLLLLELASERLLAMTSRYRLEMDNRNGLNVVDELDADGRRVISTLSGGETFLASLALALALAELVTRAGGRLQCFFLDEGFGSLDPESFDLAMDGIERIVSHDRLIGLLSHVPALAARVDDRIELDKGHDGMTVVKAGAALG